MYACQFPKSVHCFPVAFLCTEFRRDVELTVVSMFPDLKLCFINQRIYKAILSNAVYA